ncbi:hypothetical protein GCM10009780_43530 [Actinomadura alba]
MAAMHAIGGTCGVIQSCRLSWLGCYYVYGSVVARAERDQVSGAIVWRDEQHQDGTLVSEMALDVREAIECMPVAQTTAGLESPPLDRAAVDVPDAGGL